MKKGGKVVEKMKIIYATSWFWIVGIALLAGCSGTGELIRKQSIGTQSGVFLEPTEKTAPPPGFADLRISFSVKTHTSSFHIMESGTQGTPGYVLVINIDGQAMNLAGVISEENTLNERPRTPETGYGMRYRFQKDLRLRAGGHKVFVAVPENEVAVEVEIRLEEGTRNELVLEPVYATGKRIGNVYATATGKRIGKRSPNFYSHLSGVRILMNGKLL
jgi:hypothetical protein